MSFSALALRKSLVAFATLALAFGISLSPFALADDRDDDGRDRQDGDQHRHNGDDAFRIEVLSGRPDTVAGGDALVRISVKKKNVRLSDVRVELNGTDGTGAFVADPGANTLTGLVTGMRLGRNELEVDAKRKGHRHANSDIVLNNDP